LGLGFLALFLSVLFTDVVPDPAARWWFNDHGDNAERQSPHLPSFLTQEYSDRTIADTKTRCQELMTLLDIQHVVIWGHPSHSHPHAEIHEGFYAAFQTLGLDTHWFPQEEHQFMELPANIPIEHTLFVGEGQVQESLPSQTTNYYWMFEAQPGLDVPKDRVLHYEFYKQPTQGVEYFDQFHRWSASKHLLTIPPATRTLPEEFPVPVDHFPPPLRINILGHAQPEHASSLQRFVDAADSTYEHNHVLQLSRRLETMLAVRDAGLSPVLMTRAEQDTRRLSAQLLDQMSWGQLGVTTCREADTFLHGFVVADSDETELFRKTKTLQHNREKYEKLLKAGQILVRNRHTYLNRIESMLSVTVCEHVALPDYHFLLITDHHLVGQGFVSMTWREWVNVPPLSEPAVYVFHLTSPKMDQTILERLRTFWRQHKTVLWLDFDSEPELSLRQLIETPRKEVRVLARTLHIRRHMLYQGIDWAGPWADYIMTEPDADSPALKIWY